VPDLRPGAASCHLLPQAEVRAGGIDGDTHHPDVGYGMRAEGHLAPGGDDRTGRDAGVRGGQVRRPTVRLPHLELGRRAAEMLFAEIEGGSSPAITVVLRPELVVRGSTCPPAK
jgi:hypothetical protein